MAVSLDESQFFKFVIKSSKNNITEKPPKDKELRDNNMSTSSSSPPPSNEKLDEKNQDNQNSQVANKLPEVKVDDSPNNNGDSTKEPKEQENEEKSSRLTIKVPSKSSSPQLVASPSELRAKTPEPVSPSSNFFKKLGNMIRSTSDNGTAPEEPATSDSKDQEEQEEQQEQQVQQVQQLQQLQQVQQEQQEQPVANDNITENTVNTARSIDENKKEGEDKKNTPEPAAVKQRTNSLANLVNTKVFITRTSSLLKEVFDSIDRKMYPDMEPEGVAENQNKSNREAAISEREQLLENKDVEIANNKSQNPQSPQSTQNVMAEVGVALNERKEKLENLGERTEELSNHATEFAILARQLSEKQQQKSKWSFW